MTEIFSAPTVEEAKEKASITFGAPVSEISFEVLDEPKKGLLSGLFGKKDDCRVKATYNAPVVQEQTTIQQPAEPVAEAVDEDVTEEKESNICPEVQLEKMQIAAEYLESIMSHLAPDVKCIGKLENGVSFTLEGNGAGALIGRRGDTLDALQYLTSMVANKGEKEYVRMTIDTCGYRAKRKVSLQELAARISKNVLRTGRSYVLEPMNPYERRVIHSAVTEIEGVSSHSVGEEPNRKVVITSDAAPANRRDDRGRNNRGNNRRNGDFRNKKREHRDSGVSSEGPKKLDLSTSFEKDYKRPKPEDALNTGVYGKIDI
ncbi:MAG: protein jag [Oscillospiraceae bacterium]|nr:protein jag [Oscillospiraceae bacterium]